MLVVSLTRSGGLISWGLVPTFIFYTDRQIYIIQFTDLFQYSSSFN